MADTVRETLRTQFGFDEFLPGQRPVIDALLAGRSAAAVFPTGGGKSLCYQLPALLLEGVTVVVSPLIALMKDQIDALARRGISAARLDSSLSVEEYREVLRRARAGELRLLYVAPERFQNERFRGLLEQLNVALFAVDEAHCISEWGHNFRPDYLKLVEFARRSRAKRLLALTATATPEVLDDICRGFEIAPDCSVRNSCYRPNLTLLTSRPIGDRMGRYRFVIDAEGHVKDERVAEAIMGVKRYSPRVVFLGSYPRADRVEATVHKTLDDDAFRDARDWLRDVISGVDP